MIPSYTKHPLEKSCEKDLKSKYSNSIIFYQQTNTFKQRLQSCLSTPRLYDPLSGNSMMSTLWPQLTLVSCLELVIFRFFRIVRRLMRDLVSKEIKPANHKANQPWIFLGITDAGLKFQYFGHLMWTANSLEKTLMLGKIKGKRRREWQRTRL